MQVIVLGMHRSGTSVVTRLLNLMGVYFGPEGASTGANSENPKGFWERRDVRMLNDSVLHAVGCDWNRVVRLDINGLPTAVVADFDKRASRLVLEMDAHRPWLLKEPRLCLLLPLWRKWLEVPICIHVYRNPVEVASSLSKRNDIPMEAGLALWERYVRASLDASVGLPQIVVWHRQLMHEPIVAVAQLFKRLTDEGVANLHLPLNREITAFMQEDLYHEREARDDLRKYAKAPQLSLFKSLEAGRAPPGKSAKSDAGEAALVDYETSLPPLKLPANEHKASESMVVESREQLPLREQENNFAREISAKYEADLKHRDELLSRFEGDRLVARETVDRLETSLAQRDEQLASIEREAVLLRDMAVRLEAELKQRDERLAGMERAAISLSDIAVRLETDFRERGEGLADAQHEALSLRETNAGLESELQRRTEQLKFIEQEAADLRETASSAEADHVRRIDQAEAAREAEARTARTNAEENATLRARMQALDIEVRKLKEQEAANSKAAQASIKDMDSQLRALESEGRQAKLRAEQKLQARHHELTKLTQLLIARDQELVDATLALNFQRRTSAEIVAGLEQQLDAIRRSRSWRLMSPIRAATRAFRPAKTSRDQGGQDVELLRQSGLFDESWYLQIYPDVACSGQDAIEHFLRFGAKEGRDPSLRFSTQAYLEKNPDVADAGMNPLLHYVRLGKAEGRQPT